jgi:organic radical activating enzyme
MEDDIKKHIDYIKCSKNKTLFIEYFTWLSESEDKKIYPNFGKVNTRIELDMIKYNIVEDKKKSKTKKVILELVDYFRNNKENEIPDFIKNISNDCKKDESSTCNTGGNPTIDKFTDCICNTKNQETINTYIEFLTDLKNKSKMQNTEFVYNSKKQYQKLNRDLCLGLSAILDPDKNKKQKEYEKIFYNLNNCIKPPEKQEELPVAEEVDVEEVVIADEIPKPEIIKQEEPTKVLSNDAVTYITPQGLVYIHDKKTNEITEYEGSFENNKPRKVELKGDSIMVNGTELTPNNFKDLYPITNKSKHKDTFYKNLVASSRRVIQEIQSAK